MSWVLNKKIIFISGLGLWASAARGADTPNPSKGVGPVKEVTVGAIDDKLAAKGEEQFKIKCVACHEFDKRKTGPALGGVTKRRTPEWIMNMILAPEKMIKEDPTAMDLFGEFLVPMANQNATEAEARAIVEFFRQRDAKAKK